jgi:hypothetical protein
MLADFEVVDGVFVPVSTGTGGEMNGISHGISMSASSY